VHQQNVNSSDVSFDLRLEGRVLPINRSPTVSAGADFTAAVNEPALLAGTFQDDGLPSPPGVVRVEWRQVSGPATALIEGTNLPNARVTFAAPGTYVLRLTAEDGAATVSDEVSVTVGGDPYQGWLTEHFTGAELGMPEISGENADPDGDGQGNRAEYLSGTLPRDGNSVLRLRVTRIDRTRLLLGVAAIQGRAYAVEERDGAAPGVWRTVARIEAAACTCEVEVGVARQDSLETRFFRVRTP
jgi:hypothetical protein